ncbi:MAG: filamentous hemagglutinin N-terminal domain-containing protein, partial [Pleurocapsa sp. MO_226.B13]|nr:filamentous hemagglutinin N-terminal domain-containing protein [Pleurocapsa sp. MO_226.B13]
MKKELSLLFTGICCANNIFLLSNVAIAQIAIDGTTNTIVNSADNSNFTIENGDRVGGNLFHSFDAFSIPSGGSAIFNNVPEIENIFSRVTGGNISNIDGLIEANGSANLFLINPAGIIFGENARLDIGGSFYSSSASSILFEDGEFSATDLDNPPLLTINAPIGLSFRDNPGDIVNRSNFGLTNTILDSEIDPVFENPVFEGREFTLQEVTGLEIDGDRTIALIGGNVILENSAGITAPGGNVELGGLSQAGNINLNENGSLTFPEGVTRADVTLTERSKVQVAADGGGSINIHARNLELREQSELYAGIAEGMGFPDAQAGDLNINATESVRLLGNPRQTPIDFSLGLPLIDLLTIERQSATGIRNTVGISAIRRNDGSSQSSAVGNGGNIKINSQTLELSKIAVIDTGVFGSGNGGDIAINSTESVVLDQGVFLSQIQGFDEEVVKESGSGDAGNILINTNSLLLTDIALILADVQQGATGNGGDITIQVSDTFTQNQDSFILTQLGRENIGSAGDIAITAGSYEIGARTVLPALQSDSSPGSQGDAGNITIDVANDFSLTGNLIIAQIQGGATGNAGDISISANNLLIDNFALVSTNAASGTTGTAGGVSLNADNTITVSNGAVVDALTENEFDGGDITVNAQNLNLLSGGKIVTGSENLGDAGDINLNIRENLIINNQNPPDDSPFDEPILQAIELQTGLFANTFPGSTSNGGSISVKAESIDLQDRGFILAETESGSGGNINLIVEDRINLRNNSLISAEAFDRANGGNINI